VVDLSVRLVTGAVHPVVSVSWLPDVVPTTSLLPVLRNVNWFDPTDPTRTLRTITARGKVTVPCTPPFVM